LLTFDRLQIAAANATNRGGLDQDLTVMVNPRSFAQMINAEAARRQYDDSYKSSEFDNGAKEITFYYAGGSMKVVANRYVKEGEAYGFVQDTWVRSGSAQISLKVPGIDKEIIFPLENSSAFAFEVIATNIFSAALLLEISTSVELTTKRLLNCNDIGPGRDLFTPGSLCLRG
jgi:hypothetical protein